MIDGWVGRLSLGWWMSGCPRFAVVWALMTEDQVHPTDAVQMAGP
jgi:hypothetical protein